MDLSFKDGTDKQARHIDGFLTKDHKTSKKLDEMVEKTVELPQRQHLLYNLMNLTNDVRTFSSDLINRLVEADDLAAVIVEKAKVSGSTKINAHQLKLSVQKLGYGLVQNEVQESLAKEYVKIYFNNEDQSLKLLIRKSVRLAFVAKELSRILHLNSPTISFFAGMNYYIGEMVLALREPRRFKEFEKLIAKGVDYKTAEMAAVGFDMNELAAKMLEKFKLPEKLIDVISHKNKLTEVKAQNTKEAILLKFAVYVATMLGNKKTSPQAMWVRAHDFLLKLDIEMKSDDWVEEIKLLYIRLLEQEYKLYQR